MDLLPKIIVDITTYLANVVAVGGFLLLLWTVVSTLWQWSLTLKKTRHFVPLPANPAAMRSALEFLTIAMVIRTFLNPALLDIAELLALVGIWAVFAWRKEE
ncbi:MAG: hypothetical protein Q8R11_00950 [bacterium]|nr:hypothetical protein [bacterium]